MRMRKFTLAPAFQILFLCVAFTACTSNDESENLMIPIKDRKPLISIEYEGGMTLPPSQKQRKGSLIIYYDGYTEKEIRDIINKANLLPDELNKLKMGMYRLDIDKIHNTKFSGVCPTVYDGAATVFIFHMPDGDIKFSACKYELKQFKVFTYIDELLQKYHYRRSIFR